MAASLADALGAIRKPEYTGENRCLPCTGVNGVIAVVLAVVVTVVVPLETVGALTAGALTLAVSAAAIYLRGYLVPGTPHLTKTYFPDWFLRYFDHHDPVEPVEADVEPAAVLERAGAVSECDHVDDLCLTDEFRESWEAGIGRLRETDTTRGYLATVVDVPESALEFRDHGDAFVALADVAHLDRPGEQGQVQVGQWESRGAFIADMAAAGTLGERYGGWDQLAADQQGRVLNGLRIFLERCPTCGGAVELGEETVESCCRSIDVVAVTCRDCGDRLFEAEQPPAS